MYKEIVVLLIIAFHLTAVKCARILAIIPTNSYSHQVNYQPIFIELTKRGHEVITVVTTTINDPTLKNLTEIDIGNKLPILRNTDFVAERWRRPWLNFVHQEIWDYSYLASEVILNHPSVKKLYTSKTRQKIDLVIIEILWFYSLHGLAYVLDCPCVGVSSLGLLHTVDDILGIPTMPSYPSNWEMGNRTGEHLPFFNRMTNFLYRTYELYRYYNGLIPKHDEIAKKHFGKDIPSVEQIVKNISLIFVNFHETFSYPKLSIGKVIFQSGIYTSLNIKQKVSKELQKAMDDATEGFIYVSFGSNVQSKNLPKYIQQMFIDVFSNLPHKVLWKYEDDTLTSLPSNIYLWKWLPQRAILSHPNLRLFFYQGGLQSSEEAIKNGVPLVGLPVLADQDSVISRMVNIGIARHLDITHLTKEKLNEALRDVLYNKSYKANALRAQQTFNDRPYDDLNYTMWWIEYVIRNKGTPYHYYSLANDVWYSRYEEDVIAMLAIIFFVTFCVFVIVSMKTCKLCLRLFKSLQRSNEKLKTI